MADDFLVFLVTGLAIIAVLVVAFSALTGGFATEAVASTKVIDLGAFDVSYIDTVNFRDLGSKNLTNGLLFGDQQFTYAFTENGIRDATLFFRVARSNELAPLAIHVNGHLVQSRVLSTGEYEITIPREALNETMKIEIIPVSSSWQIWAPTLYELHDMVVETRSFSFSDASFDFVLLDEFRNFEEGRLELAFSENFGTLTVEINDQEVFNTFAPRHLTIELPKDVLTEGINTLELKPGINSKFTGNATIIIFHATSR